VTVSPLHRLALRVFPRLPVGLRRAVVRVVSPQHTVGAVALIEHGGDVLVLRQLHRAGHTLPGGLLSRGETAAEAVVREVREETGVEVVVDQPIAVVVAPQPRRVDVIFRVVAPARPAVRPAGEAVAAEWVPLAEVEVRDSSTRDVLQAVHSAMRDGAHLGRVVG